MIRSLSASDLLDVWERGAGRLPVEQGLLLLQTADPEVPNAELQRLPVGRRDAALLRLYARTFGPRLTGLADCPVCGENLEIVFSLDELLAGFPAPADPSPATEEPGSFRLSVEGYELTFRLPNSQDLLAAGRAPDLDMALRGLLEACLLETLHNGRPAAPQELPDGAFRALGSRIAEADPLAEITLPLDCPTCGHAWEIVLDIVSYFWGEVNGWAQRLLREVHGLAAAYGWSEADILAMSAWRRQRYLELVSE